MIRAWFLGVGMALGWEWAEGVFDSFVKMVSILLILLSSGFKSV